MMAFDITAHTFDNEDKFTPEVSWLDNAEKKRVVFRIKTKNGTAIKLFMDDSQFIALKNEITAAWENLKRKG